MDALLTQVYMRSGTTVRTCWVDKQVRRGDQVILKAEGERRWDVLAAWPRVAGASINRGWNNNI
jgi:hypothetical protein